LLLALGSWLDIFPLGRRCEPKLIGGCEPLYQRLNYLILPVFTLGTVYIAGYSRYMRTSMLDVISQDYVRTARAKGLSSRVVWFKHSARNALIPIATLLGPTITGLLAGAVLTETIFSWPGLGREAVLAVNEQNYTLVMAIVMLSAVATIAGYILSDILYAVIDPRIRFD
jgi:peptide/nickel transport system permease protein